MSRQERIHSPARRCAITISTTASKSIALGNGSTTSFTFNFIASSADDIEVIYIDTNGIPTTLSSTQYTLIINPPAIGQLWGVGGTVIYPIVGSPIANGTSLTIQRILPLTQTITISNQGDFAPQVIEEMGDTLEMQIQQIASRTGQMRGTWASGSSYSFGDIVVDGANGGNSGNYYVCAIGNVSTTWAADLSAGDWSLAIQSTFPTTSLPLSISNGGTGRSTSVTPYGLIASGVTDTGSLQTLANGETTDILVGGGSSALPAWTTATGTGSPVRADAPIFVTGITTPKIAFSSTSGIIGTSTNDDAAAGSVGQVISSDIVASTAVSVTNSVITNITSIALTPGDWDVSGSVHFKTGTTTVVNDCYGGVSTTSAAFNIGLNTGSYSGWHGAVTGGGIPQTTAPIRIKVGTATTTVYLVTLCAFTISTAAAYGFIYGRRRR